MATFNKDEPSPFVKKRMEDAQRARAQRRRERLVAYCGAYGVSLIVLLITLAACTA
jgi:hypothetical protein